MILLRLIGFPFVLAWALVFGVLVIVAGAIAWVASGTSMTAHVTFREFK